MSNSKPGLVMDIIERREKVVLVQKHGDSYYLVLTLNLTLLVSEVASGGCGLLA